MAISLVTSAIVQGAGSGSTTAAVDTTGATLIVLAISWGFNAVPTVSDSKGNTWVALTRSQASDVNQRLYYCLNPTVGSGHTFTVSGSSVFAPIGMYAFSGVASYQTETGNQSTATGTTIQPGSITPSADGGLLVTIAANKTTGTPTVDSGFTKQGQVFFASGARYDLGMAYLIQGTAAAVNPTWTLPSSANPKTTRMAAFLPPGPSANSGFLAFT